MTTFDAAPPGAESAAEMSSALDSVFIAKTSVCRLTGRVVRPPTSREVFVCATDLSDYTFSLISTLWTDAGLVNNKRPKKIIGMPTVTRETPSEARKRQLEIKKLSLEQQVLSRQLSFHGVLLEWLKAAAVPVTLLGAILAFTIGSGQLNETRENQIAERFDKALTRLASKESNERMTGVSGLQLFLGSSAPELQEQSLQFLVNAIALEKDSRVQGAILDTITGLSPGSISKSALDGALSTAVKRNRNLTDSIVSAWRGRVIQEQKEKIRQFSIPGLEIDQSSLAIPASIIAELSIPQFLKVLDVYRDPFDRLQDEEKMPLDGLRFTIQALIKLGAETADFHDIYCVQCDFGAARNLIGATFDGAYLRSAIFDGLNLRDTSFKQADLSGTSFFSADLTNSILAMSVSSFLLRGIGWGNPEPFPILECAVLVRADLSGRPIAVLHRTFDSDGQRRYNVTSPKLTSAKIDGSTKLNTLSILTATDINDLYLTSHKDDPELRVFNQDRDDLPDDPQLSDSWTKALFRRLHGDFAKNPDEYTSTMEYQISEIDERRLDGLGNDAFVLRDQLTEPLLQAVPLFAKFTKALADLKVPAGFELKGPDGISSKAMDSHATDCAEGGKKSRDLVARGNILRLEAVHH